MLTLETAFHKDLDVSMKILKEARAFQRSEGFVQWDDTYPSVEMIKNDIAEKKAFLLKKDNAVAGYVKIDRDGDPEYDTLDGNWHTDGEYAVIHRLAFGDGFRCKGLSSEAFRLIEKHCTDNKIKSIRIDTDFPNLRMQHVLEKNGYRRCGIVTLSVGKRIAFDKDLG